MTENHATTSSRLLQKRRNAPRTGAPGIVAFFENTPYQPPYGIHLDSDGLLHIPRRDDLSYLPEIPAGYAFKGGAARNVLAAQLGIEKLCQPRDIDIIRLAETCPSDALDNEISTRYMPEDARHGHGVEAVHDQSAYFNTHDFTINELYATPDEVVLTPACLRDTLQNTLRLTDYEQEYTSCKLYAKALRFAAESEYSRRPFKLAPELHEALHNNDINSFHCALHLDRALQTGSPIADEYVALLKLYDKLPEAVTNWKDTVAHLSESLHNFEYKNLVAHHSGHNPIAKLTKYAAAETLENETRALQAAQRGQLRKMPTEKPDSPPKYQQQRRASERPHKLSHPTSKHGWKNRIDEERCIPGPSHPGLG